MSWIMNHRIAENAASEAEMLTRQAKARYLEAAKAEEDALAFVQIEEKSKTYGITAVSAVALYMKAGDSDHALRLGKKVLLSIGLPDFAKKEIMTMLTENYDSLTIT